MDILTHTLSGIAVGTVAASFSNNSFKKKLLIVVFAAFAGALPDVDAISLWSHFDGILGKLFHLSHSGRDIYSAKFWYSHHAFMHSFMAAILFGGIVVILKYLWTSQGRNLRLKSLVDAFRKDIVLFVAFVSAYTLHLLEDMVTPAASWGGVNFFFPMASYTGGTGDIWWWNNYDVFLIVVGVILFNIVVLVSQRFVRFSAYKFTLTLFTLGFALALFQIHSRDIDYAYSGHCNNYQELEAYSKAQQKEILGDKTFRFMVWFDGKLKVYF
ncbi:metal-dependent hydrolase [Halosquirtibacter xylanolyticus]|uniref:metal-dependent hydrolase n=1 Tax=Halosquirtibacter xylanolyticus TaxID=3374599 RepID=UPI003749AB74|nr:metal-dependent hydrolase [Prolixibacteraceae bacterium]